MQNTFILNMFDIHVINFDCNTRKERFCWNI